MSNDPTDNALAAIASILDQPPEQAKIADKPAAAVEEPTMVGPPPPPSAEPDPSEPESSEPAPVESPPPIQPQSIQPIDANGYSKSGPGPMAALRFRWTVREDGGRYYVDETFGEAATPLVNGPMGRDEAIKFVDDRESAARQRFEHFKHEMINGAAPRSDGGEA